MDVKYQVFVSSTFEDLQDERRAVIAAILAMGHIPVGMEAFNASDEDQWTNIKRRIDKADYYVVIVAERYGAEKDDKSYTQMEYEYAVEKGKPVIAFLHKNIDALPMQDGETDPEIRANLHRFRKLAENKLCKHWENGDQLRALVTSSMFQLINRSPATGWVRANLVADESAAQEIVRLRRRIEELEEQLKSDGALDIASLGLKPDEL
ncbi:MAG: DUF4062 domain-containing protein, partial [Cytophagaceae bacterium]